MNSINNLTNLGIDSSDILSLKKRLNDEIGKSGLLHRLSVNDAYQPISFNINNLLDKPIACYAYPSKFILDIRMIDKNDKNIINHFWIKNILETSTNYKNSYVTSFNFYISYSRTLWLMYLRTAILMQNK